MDIHSTPLTTDQAARLSSRTKVARTTAVTGGSLASPDTPFTAAFVAEAGSPLKYADVNLERKTESAVVMSPEKKRSTLTKSTKERTATITESKIRRATVKESKSSSPTRNSIFQASPTYPKFQTKQPYYAPNTIVKTISKDVYLIREFIQTTPSHPGHLLFLVTNNSFQVVDLQLDFSGSDAVDVSTNFNDYFSKVGKGKGLAEQYTTTDSSNQPDRFIVNSQIKHRTAKAAVCIV